MEDSIYWNQENQRWHGEIVPAECDYASCHEDITRGIAYQCENPGCDCVYFYCSYHIGTVHDTFVIDPKGETEEWLRHIITDRSWASFRQERPEVIEYYLNLLEFM